MNITESILKFLKLDGLIQNLTGYVEARIELLKTEIREDVSKAIAKSLMVMVMFLIGFMFLIFFSIGLAQFLNKFFEESYGGYWTVAGIYAGFFLVLFLFRKSINNHFERTLEEMMKRKEK